MMSLQQNKEISRQFIESFSDDEPFIKCELEYGIENKITYQFGQKSDNLVSFELNCDFPELPNYRSGVDLLYMIDVSQSVKDENLERIKQALCCLAQCLSEYDRFSIILYSNTASRLFPFLQMRQQNKEVVLNLIRGITIQKGQANLASALMMANCCLFQRKYENQRTCLNSICSSLEIKRVSQILKQIYQYNPNMSFKAFCNEKPSKGCSYKIVFIQKIEDLSKYLCFNLSKCQQTVLKNLQIVLKNKKGFEIAEMFGGKFQYKNNSEYHIKKQYASMGYSKKHIIGVKPTKSEICSIDVSYTTLKNQNKQFSIQLEDGEINQQVLIEKYKYKSRLQFKEAIEYYDPYRIQDSKAVLKEYLIEMNQLNDNLKQSLKFEINKIEEALEQLINYPNKQIVYSFNKQELVVKTQLSQQYLSQLI